MLIPMVVSAVIGAIWGLLGYWYVSDTNMAHGAGAGPAASPLIGLAIGAWSIRVRRANFTRRALMALLNLYLAVGLFIVFMAAWHVTVGWYLLPWPLQSGGRLWAFLKAIFYDAIDVYAWRLRAPPMARIACQPHAGVDARRHRHEAKPLADRRALACLVMRPDPLPIAQVS
jgi:hypothetical protein